MNITSLLKKDHQKIKSLLKGLEGSKKKSPRFEELYKLVHIHSKAEEASFYEPLKGEKKARPLAFEGFEEHHVAATLLKELEALDAEDERWAAKLTVLNEALHHHIEEEESEMFSKARKAFSKEELDEAGRQFQMKKRALAKEYSAPKSDGPKLTLYENPSRGQKLRKMKSMMPAKNTSHLERAVVRGH